MDATTMVNQSPSNATICENIFGTFCQPRTPWANLSDPSLELYQPPTVLESKKSRWKNALNQLLEETELLQPRFCIYPKNPAASYGNTRPS